MTKGEQTRQRIIAQAAPIFNQRGYEGCSLADIMGATGLKKGGIYRHFQNKEDLAAEAFDFAWRLASSARSQNLGGFSDPFDRLKQHISNFAARSTLPGGCPLLNTAIDSDDGNPALREQVRKALRSWKATLCAILRDGIAQGTIRSDIDRKKISSVIVGCLEGGMLISRIERNDRGLRVALEHLDFFLDSQVRRPAAGNHGKRS